jgi:hypothetical protein
MLEEHSNNPENTFWCQLDQQITQITQRTRQHPKNTSLMQNSMTPSRFQVEEAWHK